MSTTQSKAPTNRLRLVLSLLVLVALVFGGTHLLRGLDFAELGASLASARPGWLVGAGACALSLQLFRALFWKLALRQERPIPLRRLLRYTVLGTASSAILPARAGEAVRVWLLHELEGVAAVDSIGAALAERAFDLVSMVLVLAPLPLLLPTVPPWIQRAELVLVAVAIGLVVALAILARRRALGGGSLGSAERGGAGPPDGGHFGARFARAFSPLAAWPRFVGALATMLGGWLVDVAALTMVAHALGLQLPPGAPLLVLLSVNLAIAVPAAPAQLGTHEAGTLIALGLVGVDRAHALAFALLYHAVHVLPLLAAAMLDAPLLARALTRREG